MALDITGKLHKVFDVEQKTDSFKAREFVIETPGEYPQFVKFQLTQDRCNSIDKFNE
jgi:single-strand DNA-binding protein